MNRKLLRTGVLAFFLLAGTAPGTSWAQSSNDFDDHWLAAACSQVPVRGRLVGEVSNRDYGVAIGPSARKTLVLYCNVDADLFHNQIQLVAEDNSPNVQVTATLFQQDIFTPGDPPLAIVSVSTEDQPGLQVAKLFFDPALEPDEFFFMYFIKIEVVRANRDPVWVYSVSMQDVL
jgi:hypothetical protein